MLFPILLLSAAGFTVLTTEFLIVGLLPPMARDLGVSVSQAGLLVTLFAFTVAAVGPFLTAALSSAPRKRIFVGTLVLLGLANVLAAFAPNIYVMAVARLVPAVILPVYWSLASATVVDLAGQERAGKAISMVTFGVICATVFGIPIGTLISDAFGWRSAFGSLAMLAFAKALMLQVFLPAAQPKQEKASVLNQMRILRDPVVAGHVLLSVLVFAGMFTPYTYLADMLERLAGFNGQLVGWTLMAFGAVGLIGNAVGGRIVDRSPLGASLLFNVVMAVGMLVLAPAISMQWALPAALAAWGIAQAGLFVVSHTRVMKSAPQAAAFAASLNISGANLGIGLGAIAGGRVIDTIGIERLGVAGAGILAIALVLTLMLMAAERGSRRPVLVSEA